MNGRASEEAAQLWPLVIHETRLALLPPLTCRAEITPLHWAISMGTRRPTRACAVLSRCPCADLERPGVPERAEELDAGPSTKADYPIWR